MSHGVPEGAPGGSPLPETFVSRGGALRTLNETGRPQITPWTFCPVVTRLTQSAVVRKWFRALSGAAARCRGVTGFVAQSERRKDRLFVQLRTFTYLDAPAAAHRVLPDGGVGLPAPSRARPRCSSRSRRASRSTPSPTPRSSTRRCTRACRSSSAPTACSGAQLRPGRGPRGGRGDPRADGREGVRPPRARDRVARDHPRHRRPPGDAGQPHAPRPAPSARDGDPSSSRRTRGLRRPRRQQRRKATNIQLLG